MSQFLTVDEKLEAFRGRCSFRPYISNKPAKYGLKVFPLRDKKKLYYTWNMEVCVGQIPVVPMNIWLPAYKWYRKKRYDWQ